MMMLQIFWECIFACVGKITELCIYLLLLQLLSYFYYDSIYYIFMVYNLRLFYLHPCRDEISMQYSRVSEESDDYRYYETQVNTNGNQTDVLGNSSTSPASSPRRVQKLHNWFSSACSYTLPSCSLPAVVCSPAPRGCGTEQEGRIPSSPNDMCHGGDLRRAALLRSVQMRAQSPHPCDVLPSGGHEQEQGLSDVHADELEQDQKEAVGVQLDQRPLSCPKSTQDAEYQSPINRDQHPHHDVDFVKDQITV